MAYFCIQYQVLFHDTMAYGSHHHTTNIKFQNMARERLIFESQVGDQRWDDQLSDVVMLTREAYSINFAPVTIGEKVIIFLTYEAPSRSTARLCFRVLKADGSPVSCGYQTIVLIHKDTKELVPGPSILTQFLDKSKPNCLLEKLQHPNFKTRIHKTSITNDLFSEDIMKMAKYIGSLAREQSYPKIIDKNLNEYPLYAVNDNNLNSNKTQAIKPKKKQTLIPAKPDDIVFTFPGQGANQYPVLWELYQDADYHAIFQIADKLSRKYFDKAFMPLIEAPDLKTYYAILDDYPDLNQLDIYLTNVLIAKSLIKKGLKPSLLVGHSFGEIAALAIAGVFSIEVGLEIVCQRVMALQDLQTQGIEGKMAAVACNKNYLQKFIDDSHLKLEITVVNHPKQTVVSGTMEDLTTLRDSLAQKGISTSILNSSYPFHSSYLNDAVATFKESLQAFEFGAAQIPVYLNSQQMYETAIDMPEMLAQQFITPLDFEQIAQDLYDGSYRLFVECGVRGIVQKILAKNYKKQEDAQTYGLNGSTLPLNKRMENLFEKLGKTPLKTKNSIVVKTPEGQALEQCTELPIAIVSMGAVLPGAKNTEDYWNTIKDGISGVVDLAKERPEVAEDFMGGTQVDVIAEKTYTLLNGTILNVEYEASLLRAFYTETEFNALTRGEKLLALAFAQTLNDFSKQNLDNKKIQCIIGATADGMEEYDSSLFLESVFQHLEDLEEVDAYKQVFTQFLSESFEYQKGDIKDRSQLKLFKKVVKRILERTVKTYVIDSACSSSLYAIHTGIRSLQTYDADVIYAGGVFAPGPANNTLFAQFRGLTPDGIRPMDSGANGVTFSDGAAFVVLKRLPDAVENGDKILGVIRGIGLSSDGKSPSINVPRAKGQSLAIKRAYRHSNVDMNSIQYVEAHATSTPVGDAVEFKSLSQSFADNRPTDLPKIQIASVKSLIGHTGWVSGVASVIKICKAFEKDTIPKQYSYSTPNESFHLTSSPFSIAEQTLNWEDNLEDAPKRAGINSFGFGGTNAHLIIEKYKKDYHSLLCYKTLKHEQTTDDFVVVGMSSLFPSSNDELATTDFANIAKFNREKLHLPPKKLLLPDVTDHMDISQFLSSLAAHHIFAQWPKKAKELYQNIGVVLGIEDKTERGKNVLDRIFLDHLNRIINEKLENAPHTKEMIERVLAKLINHIKDKTIASGPYTLPGLMPNVTASRIAHIFNLNGPNIAVDSGKNSLFQALSIAKDFLMNDACKIVLAGAINADNTANEGMLLLGITSPDIAEEYNLPILSKLNITEISKAQFNGEIQANEDKPFNGAQGCLDIIKVLQTVQDQKKKIAIRDFSSDNALKLIFSPVNANNEEDLTDENKKEDTKPETAAPKSKKTALRHANENGAYSYVQNTPIETYHPTLVATPIKTKAIALEGRSILFVTDQPDIWRQLETSGHLDKLNYQVVLPNADTIKNAISIQAENIDSLKVLNNIDFSEIIVVKNVVNYSADTILKNGFEQEDTLLNMLFAISKYNYEAIKEGKISLNTLTLDSIKDGQLNPYTGLFAGFMKSTNRELPNSNCSIVHTNTTDFSSALQQLATEMSLTSNKQEVTYLNSERQVFQLQKIEKITTNQQAIINKDSVIIATGGGRGVTAVLIEDLIRKYQCTVIALGRTNLEDVPSRILGMSDEEFHEYEGKFYKEELAKKDGRSIIDIKQQYHRYQAANELHRSIQNKQQLGGMFDYVSMNINDAKSVEKLVKYAIKKYGKVDMIIHGAGVQVSKALPKKSYHDFTRIVETKLSSLSYLYQACQEQQPKQTVHYHLLTSAFSYLGNDGQPDYGAANETMNRLANALHLQDKNAHWTSLAWLGWAGIGMTRGSEYAALAASRNLRGITKEEGQQIFMNLMKGHPTTPINILLAEGEITHYQPLIAKETVQTSTKTLATKLTKTYLMNLENAPFLIDHQAKNTPTLPGTFILCLMAETAQELRPDLKVIAFKDFDFKKFIKVFNETGLDIRVVAKVKTTNKKGTLIHVQVLSDFVHSSGRVLRKDILHTEGFVFMSENIPTVPESQYTYDLKQTETAEDPYLMPDAPIQLNGHFDTMSQITLGQQARKAAYILNQNKSDNGVHQHLIKQMTFMDALLRFGSIQKNEDATYDVFIPRSCEEMNIYFDFFKTDAKDLERLQFVGGNPKIMEDDEYDLAIGPLEVLNKKGEVVLTLQQGLCKKFGQVGELVLG